MELYIDGVPRTGEYPGDMQIRDFVEEFRDWFTTENRLIVAITCDGEEIMGTAMEDILDAPVSRYERIELTTSSACELATDLLSSLNGMLVEARDVQAQVVDLLSQGTTVRAMELLSNCFGVWNQAQQGLSRAAEALHLDLDAVTFEDKSAAAFIGELATALRNVRDALESRDYVTLSDILAYEFDGLTERWQRLNETLLVEADATGS